MRKHFLATAALFTGASLAMATPGTAAPSSLIEAIRDDFATDISTRLKGSDVNARDELGSTPLSWAVVRQSPAVLNQLLAASADPNLADMNGVGPLLLAVDAQSPEMVRALLDKGADPNAANAMGETALMAAIRVGSLDMVKVLLEKGANPNAKQKNFAQTPLMWAAGHPEMVKMLLAKGADPRAVTKSWEVTATIYTPTTGTLGQTGIPWNNAGDYKSSQGGMNAVMFAVQKGDIESVKMLLDAGVEVNQAAADGATPLLASLFNFEAQGPRAMVFAPNVKIANLLLDRGAKVNVVAATGYTPLHGAALILVMQRPGGSSNLAYGRRRQPPPMPPPATAAPPAAGTPGLGAGGRGPQRPRVSEDDVLALAKRLLDAGADPNVPVLFPAQGPVGQIRINPAPPGSTPMHVAGGSGSPRLVQVMAQHGGDPNRVRKDGHTAFTVAVMANDLPVVKALVSVGADVKKRYSPNDEIPDPVESKTQQRQDETALHVAAVVGAQEVVAYLIEAGVPADAKDRQGETAVQLAEAQEQYRYAIAVENLQPVSPRPNEPTVKPVKESATSDAIRKAMQKTGTKTASARTGSSLR